MRKIFRQNPRSASKISSAPRDQPLYRGPLGGIGVFTDRSISRMEALGPERVVEVSVVVLVVLVVVQPTSVNKPAQARHMIAFFI